MTLRAAAETRAALRQQGTWRAPRNFVPSAELGPRREGARSSLCGNASAALLLSPPRHGDRSEFSHPRPRERNSIVWRVAEVAKEEAGASRRRGGGAGSPERSSRLQPGRPLQRRGPRVRGCPALFRKSTWSRRPARNAGDRGAGLLSQPLGGRDARTGPCPPDFHLPPGKTWEPRPSRGWGRRRQPGEPHWDPGLSSGLGPAPAGLQVSRWAATGTGQAEMESRSAWATPPCSRRTLESSEASAGKAGGRRVSEPGGPGSGSRRLHPGPQGRAKREGQESPRASAPGFPPDSPRAKRTQLPDRPFPGARSRCLGPPRPRATQTLPDEGSPGTEYPRPLF